MARLVMKFGGTSVADIDRIRNVARHVKREVDAGHEVAVVVSAMAGTTNQLVAWAREAAPLHDAREYDAVVASGEQVTAGLMAIVQCAHGRNKRELSKPGSRLAALLDGLNNDHSRKRTCRRSIGQIPRTNAAGVWCWSRTLSRCLYSRVDLP